MVTTSKKSNLSLGKEGTWVGEGILFSTDSTDRYSVEFVVREEPIHIVASFIPMGHEIVVERLHETKDCCLDIPPSPVMTCCGCSELMLFNRPDEDCQDERRVQNDIWLTAAGRYRLFYKTGALGQNWVYFNRDVVAGPTGALSAISCGCCPEETSKLVNTITTQDEGSTVVTSSTALNFVGSGVTATDSGEGVTTITVSGDGGGGGEPLVESVNGETGVVVLDSDDISEGVNNLYMTPTERTKLTGVESGATADQTGSEIKALYEAEPDTNAFTDTDVSKLSGIEVGAEVNVNADWTAVGGDAEILNKPVIPTAFTDLSGDSDDIPEGTTNLYMSPAEQTKLAGIEAGATDDQTAAEIEAIVNHDSLLGFDPNEHIDWTITGAEDVHDDRIAQTSVTQHEASLSITQSQISDLTKTIETRDENFLVDSAATILNFVGSGITAVDSGAGMTTVTVTGGGGAPVDSVNGQTGVVVLDSDDITEGAANLYMTSAERTKLTGVESGATADQTPAEIKTAYESNADTNAFTDADHTKLDGIEAGAEVNVNADWTAVGGDAEILNKPTIPTALSDLTGDSDDITEGTTNLFMSSAEQTKLAGIESGATGDQTAAEIEAIVNHDNLAGFVVNEHIDWTVTGAEDIHDDRIAEASVTQHEAALTLTESQISDLTKTVATQDEGVSIDTTATTLNFVGSGVTATDAGGGVTTVTIAGGGAPVDSVNGQTGVVVLDSDDISEGATNLYMTSAERTKLTGIEAGATGDQTGAEIKALYEAEPDTNAFTDADHTKLDGIEAGAEVNVQADWNSVGGDSLILNKPTIPSSLSELSGDSDDITEGTTNLFMSSAEQTKLSGIEANATADQTAGEIEAIVNHDNLLGFVVAEHIDWSITGAEDVHIDRISEGSVTQHEAALSITESQISDLSKTVTTQDEGVLVDSTATTLNFVGSGVTATDAGSGVTTITISGGGGAPVDSVNGQTGVVVLDSDDIAEGTTNLYMSAAEQTKLSGIETGATADQTGAEIKALYEAEANTNAFTDAEQTKLSGIETGATADQTGPEIEAIVNHDNLLGFVVNEHIDWTVTGAEDVHDDRISQTSVTQHQAALTITESQISDLTHNEVVDDTTPQLGGDLDLNSNAFTGEYTAGATLAAGDLCYLNSSGQMVLTDADVEISTKGMLAICTEALTASTVGTFILYGNFTTTGLTTGDVYFVSTTAGDWTNTAPSVTGDFVRVVGYATSTTNLFFNPDGTWIEVA